MIYNVAQTGQEMGNFETLRGTESNSWIKAVITDGY